MGGYQAFDDRYCGSILRPSINRSLHSTSSDPPRRFPRRKTPPPNVPRSNPHPVFNISLPPHRCPARLDRFRPPQHPPSYPDSYHPNLPPPPPKPPSLPHFHSSPGTSPAPTPTAEGPKPSILLLTPSIITSLSPAFHAPEALINSALTSLSTVLTAEISPLKIPVTHLQLGTFDLSAFTPHSRNTSTPAAQRAETLKWDDSTRVSYSRNFVAMTSSSPGGSKSGLGKGTPLRELNNAVFDAIVRGRGGVIRVGMGSGLYGFVGKWVPSGLVAWMMGVRRVDGGAGNVEGRGEFGRGLIMARPGSSSGGSEPM